MLFDSQLDLAGDFQRRGQEHVQRVIHRAFGRVFDGHDAEVSDPAFDFVKYLVNRVKRQSTHGMAEVLVNRRLRKSTLRPEESDLQRLLLGQASRHDLPKQAQHFLVTYRALISGLDLPQHLGFAFRSVIVDCRSEFAFRHADLLRMSGTFVDQRLDALVDLVNPFADRR